GLHAPDKVPHTVVIAAVTATRSDWPSREKCPGHPCQARSSACDRRGFSGGDGHMPGRRSFRGGAQCPSPSREGDAPSRRYPSCEIRRNSIYGGTLRRSRRYLLDTARLLPGTSGHEPEAVSVDAADEPGAAGTAKSGLGTYDSDRNRHELWVLGIGPLFGCLPLNVRRIALDRPAAVA